MLADPQAVTVSGATGSPFSLPRMGNSDSVSIYGITGSTDGMALDIRQTVGKRNRHQVRFKLTKTAPNPLISAQNIIYSATVLVTVDAPPTGFTTAELVALCVGAFGNLTAGSNANLTKVIGGEL